MAENRMELFIETLTGAAFELKVSPYETIMSIKAKIQYLEGIPIAQQHLIWQAQELEDDLCLQDYSITDGSTLKLVLGMRGGPINTRRVSVESKQIQDISEYVEGNSEELSERLSSGQPLTVLVFHDGDKVHMYTVIDRSDGDISRLSGSVSETSIKSLSDDEDEETIEKRKENDITRQKMALLQQQMQNLSIRKMPKRRIHPSPPTTSENSGSHLKLPPLNQGRMSTLNRQLSRQQSVHRNQDENEILGASCRFPSVRINNLCSSINHQSRSFGNDSSDKNSASSSSERASNSPQMLNIPDSNNEPNAIQHSISTESLPYLPPAPQTNVPSFGQPKRTLVNLHPQNSTAVLSLKPPYKTVKYLPNHQRNPCRYTSITGTPSMATRRLLELDQWLNSRPKTTPSKDGVRERSFSRNAHRLGLGALVAAGLRVLKSPEEGESSSKPKHAVVTSKPENKQTTNKPYSGHKLPPLKTKKKAGKRCSWCNKKTGLATSYSCRCGKNFCATHRYAEVHHCSYDYKTEGRRFLQQTNPVVTAPKLPKI